MWMIEHRKETRNNIVVWRVSIGVGGLSAPLYSDTPIRCSGNLPGFLCRRSRARRYFGLQHRWGATSQQNPFDFILGRTHTDMLRWLGVMTTIEKPHTHASSHTRVWANIGFRVRGWRCQRAVIWKRPQILSHRGWKCYTGVGTLWRTANGWREIFSRQPAMQTDIPDICTAKSI